METSKTVNVFVNTNRLMASYETASISVTSPTGKTVTLYKRHIDGQVHKDLFWKLAASSGSHDVTIEEMRLIFEYSNIPFFGKRKSFTK